MTGRFAPVNDDHAIEQVLFTLTFSRPFLAEDLAAFRNQHGRWSQALPAVREPAGLSFVVDSAKGLRTESAPGVEFAFVRPDGTSVWALRVLGPEITIECTRYSRWERIWGAAFKHLSNVLEVVEALQTRPTLVRLTHVVHDAFAASLTEQDPSALLTRSDLLPASVFDRGPDWHAHSGWFSELAGERVLQNLNIDAISEPGIGLARINIIHLMALQRETLPAQELAADQAVWLDTTMAALHSENKALMGRILIPDVLVRIGLQS